LVVVPLGAALSLALVGLAFFKVTLAGGLHIQPRFELGRWIAELPNQLGWALPFVALTATLALWRAMMWGAVLPPPRTPLATRYHAIALGGLVHNAAPGRLGLFASAWVLGRRGDRPFGAAFSSLLLAKLLELGALVSTVALLVALAGAQGIGGPRLPRVVGAGAVALLVFGTIILLAGRFAPRLGAAVAARGRFPRFGAALSALGAGLVAVRSFRRLAGGFALAFVPVMASTLAYGLALRHMGVTGGLLGGGLMLGALTFGQFTPGLPIGVGVYYLISSWAARELGATDAQAAALAAISHAATTVTHLLVGVVSAVLHRDWLRELIRMRGRKQQILDDLPAT
jgi:hypothetical protein